MKKPRKFLAISIISLFTLSLSPQILLETPQLFRRLHNPQESLITATRNALLEVLQDSEVGQKALQYGLTLGSKELREQTAKIIAGLGIKTDPEKNLGIFHNLPEIAILLGEIFINPGDIVYYQSDSDVEFLRPLEEYYGAVLKKIPSSGLLPNNEEKTKLVYISNSKELKPTQREDLLKLAQEKNFLILERSLNAESDHPLKIDDTSGRVLYLGTFSEIPVLTSFGNLLPLVYLEASSEIMRKIEIAKGALTLCTNSLLQGMLINALSPYVDDIHLKFQEDATQISGKKLKELLSQRGSRLKPSEIREILKYAAIKDLIYLAGGIPDPQLFPLDKMAEIVNNLTPEQWAEIINYSSYTGLASLKTAMADYISKRDGISLSANNVVVTNGSQEALDLIGRIAAQQGRQILTESPTYLGALTASLPHTGEENIIHLDLRNPEVLTRQLNDMMNKGKPAPIIYVTPTFGNPSGYLWTEEERRNFIEVVRTFREKGYGVLVIEDDPYGELNYTEQFTGEFVSPSSLFSLYPEGVIYLFTNSKVLAPGTRIGYIIGKEENISPFSHLMKELDVEVSPLSQMLSAVYISSGMLEEHVQLLRKEYAQKAQAMDNALNRFMPKGVTWTKPLGGMFVWVKIPQEWGLDLTYLLHNVAVNGVEGIKFAYVPGEAFSIDGSTANAVRLCFTTASIEDIYKGIYAFAELIRQQRR